MGIACLFGEILDHFRRRSRIYRLSSWRLSHHGISRTDPHPGLRLRYHRWPQPSPRLRFHSPPLRPRLLRHHLHRLHRLPLHRSGHWLNSILLAFCSPWSSCNVFLQTHGMIKVSASCSIYYTNNRFSDSWLPEFARSILLLQHWQQTVVLLKFELIIGLDG